MKLNATGQWLVETLSDEYDDLTSVAIAKKAIKLFVKVPLTNNQFAALVSLITYIGVDAFKSSKLLKMLNASRGDWKTFVKAADQFDLYIHANSEHGRTVETFLITHRSLEKSLFLTPEIVKKE